MNKKHLIILFSSLIFGLLTLSSCSKVNSLNDLEGSTFEPKERLADNQTKFELFFETGTKLIIKVRDFDLPKNSSQIDKEEFALAKENGLFDMDFPLDYTYDKITSEIKIIKTDKTVSNATSKFQSFVAKILDERMEGKSDTKKALALILIMSKVNTEVNEKFDEFLSEIESMIYNEKADEIILRIKKKTDKESEVVIFKNKD